MPEYVMGDLRTGLTLDVAGSLIREHFRDLLKINFYLFIPFMFFATLIGAYLNDETTISGALQNIINLRENPEMAAPTTGDTVLKLLGLLLHSLAALVSLLFLTPVTTAASLYYLACRYLGRPITPREALRRGFRKYGAFLLCSLLYWLILLAFWLIVTVVFVLIAVVGGGGGSQAPYLLILLLPVGLGLAAAYLYLSVRYGLCFPVVMVEDSHDVVALRRSSYLTRERIWRGILLFLVASLINFLVVAGAAVIPVIWLSTALTTLGVAVTQTFLCAVLLCYYFNCRSLHENFDVHLLAQQAFPAGAEPALSVAEAKIESYRARELLPAVEQDSSAMQEIEAPMNNAMRAGVGTPNGDDSHA